MPPNTMDADQYSGYEDGCGAFSMRCPPRPCPIPRPRFSSSSAQSLSLPPPRDAFPSSATSVTPSFSTPLPAPPRAHSVLRDASPSSSSLSFFLLIAYPFPADFGAMWLADLGTMREATERAETNGLDLQRWRGVGDDAPTLLWGGSRRASAPRRVGSLAHLLPPRCRGGGFHVPVPILCHIPPPCCVFRASSTSHASLFYISSTSSTAHRRCLLLPSPIFHVAFALRHIVS
ncbi:hypothetical protein C8R44DRAFT_888024 [Mycena epipterygia]|nr:hypothetical protein C8R44DRAFT_888024 [Mycena epipterygia]